MIGSNSKWLNFVDNFFIDGHSVDSTCIDEVISKYVRGTIPEDAGNDGPDVECDINANPFSE